MREAFDSLSVAAARDGNWAAIRSALGTESGNVQLNVAGNSISSSLLPMLDRHAAYAPKSRYKATELVPLNRLDVAAAAEIHRAKHPFLKIDTQGYEAQVLRGAEGVLNNFVGVELEMTLVPLYNGQLLILDTMNAMRAFGFEIRALSPGLVDESGTGETLQVDAIFLRERHE
jgi:FkbM family methyltransferase